MGLTKPTKNNLNLFSKWINKELTKENKEKFFFKILSSGKTEFIKRLMNHPIYQWTESQKQLINGTIPETCTKDLIEQRDPIFGMSILHIATILSIDLNLEEDVNIDITDASNNSPLKYAIINNNLNIATKLLEKGSNVEFKNEEGQTPLICAISINSLPIIQLLFTFGANYKTTDSNNRTPLMYASISDRIDIVQLLLEHGADPDATDSNGNTAIFHSLLAEAPLDITYLLINKSNNYDGIKDLLLSEQFQKITWYQKDDNEEDITHNTLTCATLIGNITVVRLLLEHGINPNNTGHNDNSCLTYAIIGNNDDICELLLKHGADPNTKDNRGVTPLMQALLENKENIINLLFEYGADPDIQDHNGCSSIHHSLSTSSPHLTNSLIAKSKIFKGKTIRDILLSDEKHKIRWYREESDILFYLAKHDITDLTKELLDRKDKPLNINIQNANEFTPLQIAIILNRTQFIHLLLKYIDTETHKLDVNIVNNTGFSALSYSLLKDNIQIFEKLLPHTNTMNVNAIMPNGHTILTFACERQECKILELLARRSDVDPTITTKHGNAISILSTGYQTQGNKESFELLKYLKTIYTKFDNRCIEEQKPLELDELDDYKKREVFNSLMMNNKKLYPYKEQLFSKFTDILKKRKESFLTYACKEPKVQVIENLLSSQYVDITKDIKEIKYLEEFYKEKPEGKKILDLIERLRNASKSYEEIFKNTKTKSDKETSQNTRTIKKPKKYNNKTTEPFNKDDFNAFMEACKNDNLQLVTKYCNMNPNIMNQISKTTSETALMTISTIQTQQSINVFNYLINHKNINFLAKKDGSNSLLDYFNDNKIPSHKLKTLESCQKFKKTLKNQPQEILEFQLNISKFYKTCKKGNLELVKRYCTEKPSVINRLFGKKRKSTALMNLVNHDSEACKKIFEYLTSHSETDFLVKNTNGESIIDLYFQDQINDVYLKILLDSKKFRAIIIKEQFDKELTTPTINKETWQQKINKDPDQKIYKP